MGNESEKPVHMIKTPKPSLLALLLATFLGSACFPSSAQALLAPPIIIANSIVRPEAIEKTIRQAIATAMKGDSNGDALFLSVQKVSQTIPIPEPQGEFASILETLGIKKSIEIEIAPIEADFTLPASNLALTVTPIHANRFAVKVQWKITELKAKSRQLSILVPQGLFDQAFQIDSKPLLIGLTEDSNPIKVSLEFEVEFTESGAKMYPTKFKTNLNAKNNGPELFVKLGPLTVGKEPLTLDLIGEHGIHADEQRIREQFKQIEPNIIKTIQKKLEVVVQEEFTKISEKVVQVDPFKFSIDSNELLESQDATSPLRKLFSDIKMELKFSYLQYMENLRLFSAEIAAQVCFKESCLTKTPIANSMTTEDLRPVSDKEDVGALVYESWVQSFFHSPQFQTRLRKYYKEDLSVRGVDLGEDGVRIHFNPQLNAFVVVLNLSIDIRKAVRLGSSPKVWADWFGAQAGSAIEYFNGTGRVKLPIEIVAKIGDIEMNEAGLPVLTIHTQIPFADTAIIQNTYHYPDNTDHMTKLVKTKFLKTVAAKIKEKLSPQIPTEIKIPLASITNIKGYKLNPKKALITPNRGLLFTAELKDYAL